MDPEEKINHGYKEIKQILIDELREKLLEVSPTKFEELVLDLIRSLGYGIETGKVEHTGGSGDFGIDGIVHLDKLGLDKIYLQAKRYKPENKISSSDIQKFFGALKGRHASKGIFITTSSYQSSALEYAKAVSDTLVLVDGNKIAELMIEAEVGVSAKRKIIIPEIDNDYFER
ncbi:MAG: restriction endonuclease [Proteobacteria bacterium]|nr:restriction endonuclease [Pseudomonadota bacterium]